MLEDILVLDLSQFLAGPSASLRLADLGARVIKIERPGTGDICRHLYVSDFNIDDESAFFHAINRNKESLVIDLKTEEGKTKLKKLIQKSDVLMHNFRPGVIERLGFGYETVKALNDKIVYASISGYGPSGPWAEKPGQDLLLQSLSGLTWLSGDKHDGPVPMGLAIADILSGCHLVQGILAALIKRGVTEQGSLVEVSMLESICDFQFEMLTTWYRDGGSPPERTEANNAHAYLGAPYGIYATANGHIALAMGSVLQLGELLECPLLLQYIEPASWFTERDAIKKILAAHLKTKPSAHWLQALEKADYWCAEVQNWHQLFKHEGFLKIDMLQEVERISGVKYTTTRCPVVIDGIRPANIKGSPKVGEHNHKIEEEFFL